MYDNIGGKIKGLAKIIFIIEAVGAIITGIALLITGVALFGLLILVCGPLVAWVSSWILYAFGELVETTAIEAVGFSVILFASKTCEANNTRRLAEYHCEAIELPQANRVGVMSVKDITPSAPLCFYMVVYFLDLL